MGTVLAVALGGALGAVGRYALTSQVDHWVSPGFPWGILAVNVVGCFVMGVVAEAGASVVNLSPEARAFLTVGVLGGFTTFSAFALDTAMLMDRGYMMSVLLYVSASVIGSIAALLFGIAIVRSIAS
ncbi:MAG: fluoride efflux transporter CrcB [Micropepsaceae bacterium]